MNKRQFFQLAVMTALETFFFNDAIMSEHYFLAVFWAYFLVNNLRAAYAVEKLVRTIDKQIKKKKK